MFFKRIALVRSIAYKGVSAVLFTVYNLGQIRSSFDLERSIQYTEVQCLLETAMVATRRWTRWLTI